MGFSEGYEGTQKEVSSSTNNARKRYLKLFTQLYCVISSTIILLKQSRMSRLANLFRYSAKLVSSSNVKSPSSAVKILSVCQTDSHPTLTLLRLQSDNIYDPQDMTPPISPYVEKTGETTELKRARLLYQSRK